MHIDDTRTAPSGRRRLSQRSALASLLSFATLVALIFASVDRASATTLISKSTEDLAADAAIVARGRVLEVRTRLAENGRVYHYAMLEVDEVYKGLGLTRPGERLVWKGIGGRHGALVDDVAGCEDARVGDDVVVFLVPDLEAPEPFYYIEGMSLGYWAVERHEAKRSMTGARLVGDLARDRIELATLARIALESSRWPDPYINPVPADWYQAVDVADQVTPSYAIYNPPKRWILPDQGGSIDVFVNESGFPSGIASDFGTAADWAISQWSSVDGSSLRLGNAGPTTLCGFNPVNSVTTIAVDCANEIQGTGCRSSILGIGGPRTYSGTHVRNGITFNTVTSGDVVIQDFSSGDYCPEYTNQTKLNGVISHELGHVVGLQHSSDTTATMYGYFHTGNETLEADDRAGILYLYEAAPGPPSIAAVTPSSGEQRLSSYTVEITGMRLTGTDGQCTVTFSGTGVSINSYTSRSSTRVVLSIKINNNATPGPRTVTLATNLGSTSGGQFTVDAAPRAPYGLYQVGPNCRFVWQDPSLVNTGAQVWKKPGTATSSGTWVRVDNVPDASQTYTDWDAVPGQTYSYKVRNYIDTAAGKIFSGYSEILTLTQPASAAVVGDTGVPTRTGTRLALRRHVEPNRARPARNADVDAR